MDTIIEGLRGEPVNDRNDSRLVTFDLMSKDPDYYFILDTALGDFAARERAEAEDYPDSAATRTRWAEGAESALERIEAAMNAGPQTTADRLRRIADEDIGGNAPWLADDLKEIARKLELEWAGTYTGPVLDGTDSNRTPAPQPGLRGRP